MNLLAMIPVTTASLPQQQGPASTASTGGAPAPFHVDAPSATSPDQSNSNTSPTSGHTGNNSSQNDNSQFGKLLASKQSANSSPSSASNTAQPEQDASDTPSEASNQTASALMALLLQMQQVTPSPASSAQVDGNIIALKGDKTSANEPPLPMKELLAELTALLKQALQTPTSGDTTAAAPTTAAPIQQTAQDTNEQTTPPSDLMALILAFLQQQGAATPATTAEPAATEDDTLSITTQQSSSPTQQLTAALTQLANLIEQQASTQTNSESTTDTTIKNALATPVDTAPVQAAVAEQAPTLPKPDVKTAKADDSATTKQPLEQPRINPELQQAIARAVDAISQKDILPTQQDNTDKQDTTSDTIPSVPAIAAHTQAPVQNTDFIKHVQQPSPSHNTPVVDQVLVQVKNAVSDGSSQIRIQLHPEDLGKVDVQMNTSADGKTTVTISSDNRNTLALLQNEARALQDALRDIGLKTDAGGLNFNLRDSGQDARNSSKQQQGGYTNVAGVQETDDDYGLSTTGTLYRISVQQGLDIRV